MILRTAFLFAAALFAASTVYAKDPTPREVTDARVFCNTPEEVARLLSSYNGDTGALLDVTLDINFEAQNLECTLEAATFTEEETIWAAYGGKKYPVKTVIVVSTVNASMGWWDLPEPSRQYTYFMSHEVSELKLEEPH